MAPGPLPPRRPAHRAPEAVDRARRRLVRAAVAAVVVANAFVAGVVARNLGQGRALREEQAVLSSQSMARLLEHTLEGVFSRADLGLRAVADEHARQRAEGRADPAALEAVVAAQKSRLPDVLSIRLVDAGGVVGLGRPAATERVVVSDRDYFLAQRDAAGDELFISRPAVGRIIKVPLVFLSRRLERADGAFDGVVFATVTLERFAQILAEVEVGPRGVAILRFQDLTAVVRRTGDRVEPLLEPSEPSPPLRVQVQAGRTAGHYTAHAPKDGVERVYGWRRMEGRPFYVLVGLASEDLLAGWWREVAQAAALVVLFAAVTSVGAWWALRAAGRHEAAVAALREAEARLQQAQRLESVGRLAGGVAHDFNNMLSVILGEAALLAEELPLDHPAQAAVREITVAGERSRGLTRQLLAFSRRQAVSPRLVSLAALVEAARPVLLRLLGEDVRLEVEAAPGLSPVLLDPGQFDQVLINLVVNARDAMPSGGRVTVRVANARLDAPAPPGLEGLPPGDYAVLTVADEGHGMDEETLAHLFEPFFTTKPEGKGTGLGLATVYGIVRQAGGSIRVTSRPGQGAAFELFLPAATGEAGPAARAPAEAARGRGTILLAEDEAPVRRTTRRLLEQLGYRVVEAASGDEVLAAATDRPFDLLVSDVMLPGMKGPEIAARVREIRPGTPVLLISGYAPADIAGRGVEETGARLLLKPFRREELAAAVEAALRERQPPPAGGPAGGGPFPPAGRPG